jgi:hypothetical protein
MAVISRLCSLPGLRLGRLTFSVRRIVISGSEDLSEIFSIFHDGEIVNYASDGSDLELKVEIMYLAERVDPDYRSFQLRLHNVRDINFETWPKDSAAEPAKLFSIPQIFEPELEISGAEPEGDSIKIICNQSSPQCEYSGGTLLLQADYALVTDEGGKEYSLEELRQICSGYWSDWKNEKD